MGFAHLPLNGFVGWFGKNSFVKQQMPFVLKLLQWGKEPPKFISPASSASSEWTKTEAFGLFNSHGSAAMEEW